MEFDRKLMQNRETRQREEAANFWDIEILGFRVWGFGFQWRGYGLASKKERERASERAERKSEKSRRETKTLVLF